ncbi:amino acid transporter [Xanthomonas oryzae]|nr:amino acid transporter [Xanthomonas oryzae]
MKNRISHVPNRRSRLRAAHHTTALTARRARPVLGSGMDPASTALVSAPSAPTWPLLDATD